MFHCTTNKERKNARGHLEPGPEESEGGMVRKGVPHNPPSGMEGRQHNSQPGNEGAHKNSTSSQVSEQRTKSRTFPLSDEDASWNGEGGCLDGENGREVAINVTLGGGFFPLYLSQGTFFRHTQFYSILFYSLCEGSERREQLEYK